MSCRVESGYPWSIIVTDGLPQHRVEPRVVRRLPWRGQRYAHPFLPSGTSFVGLADYGLDCASIDGVDEVRCAAGQCVIGKLRPSFPLSLLPLWLSGSELTGIPRLVPEWFHARPRRVRLCRPGSILERPPRPGLMSVTITTHPPSNACRVTTTKRTLFRIRGHFYLFILSPSLPSFSVS